MSTPQRFSLRAAVTDKVSTGRREDLTIPGETEATSVAAAVAEPNATKTRRPSTRQGARGVTVWVEPEVYRMIKLIGLDADMTTQDVMMEAIHDLFVKKGKGRIAKTR